MGENETRIGDIESVIARSSAEADLDHQGWGLLGGVLSPAECAALIASYDEPNLFRSRIVMARHGFGSGEYQYFAYPLPDLVQALRTTLYARVAPIANRWNAAMGIAVEYPATLDRFLARCHDAGQPRPTPLLLRYGPGD